MAKKSPTYKVEPAAPVEEAPKVQAEDSVVVSAVKGYMQDPFTLEGYTNEPKKALKSRWILAQVAAGKLVIVG